MTAVNGNIKKEDGYSILSNIDIICIDGREYKICPCCGCRLKLNNFNRHILQQHEYMLTDSCVTQFLNDPVSGGNFFTTCPRCNRDVKQRNLNKHIRRCIQITPPPHRKKPTRETAAEWLKARNELNLVNNKEISEYLRKNPSKDGIGKFGVPQDKYRWGFYGHTSMEYDNWRKVAK